LCCGLGQFENALLGATEDDQSVTVSIQCDEFNVGTSALVKNDEQLKSGCDDDYAFIDIRTWRAKGVLPIPFHGEEKLVSYEFSSSDEEAEAGENDDAE